MVQSRSKGIVISYIVTAIRSISNFLLTALYLRKLGVEEYGFYQYVYAVASYVTILDFGINSVLSKYVVAYREENNRRGEENILFYCLVYTIISVIVISISGMLIISNIPTVFGDMSAERILLAKQLLIIIIAYLLFALLQHYFEGVILSYEKYVTLKLVSLFQVVTKIVVVILLLWSGMGVIAIALGDCIAMLACLLFNGTYSFVKLRVRIKYHFYDKKIICDSTRLALSLCLQSVILYANTSIDKFVLGRMLGDVAVTIYSVAWNLEGFFEEIPTVIQRLYLPQAVKLVHNNATGKELTDFVIQPGRFQCILCTGMLGGFILFGRQLISIWSGEDTLFAWWIALLLMIPSIIPLVQNVCLAILTAMNKRMFRSLTLCAVAVANLVLTIILVDRYGIVGAPIGTFISCVIGNNVAMNLYYKYKIGIEVKRLLASIFKGIGLCGAITTIVCTLLLLVPLSGVLWLMCECITFLIIYFLLLWKIGLNDMEKDVISNILQKIKTKIVR